MDKKYWIGIITSVIILPTLVFGWKNIQAVWATPDAVAEVSKKVDKQSTSLEQIAQLSLEQKARQDKAEAVSQVQIQALQAQLELVSELKKKK